MTLDPNERFELRRLIVASQDGELSNDERERLDAFVLSPGGAEEAASLLDQLSALEDAPSMRRPAGSCAGVAGNAGTPVSDSENASTTVDRGNSAGRDPTKWRGISSWVIATSAAILILSHLSIGALSWSLAQRKTASTINASESTVLPEGTTPVESPDGATSYLVSTTACVWFPSRMSTPKVGQSMRLGETLSLVEGIAELGFGPFGNDRVRIEGPASAFIRPDGALSLQSGALTAEVAGGSPQHFVVDTPMGPVRAANGASMGIVMNLQSMELHVFKGRVIVEAGEEREQESAIELAEGEAVRFTIDSEGEMEIVFHNASATEFASARSMGFDPLKISDEYVSTILEADPVIYWRFEESIADSPKRIANQGNLPGFDAVIHGDVRWRQYASNRVAEFGLSDNSSVIVSEKQWPSKELDEYTVELWMKPTCFHHGTGFCLTSPNPSKNNGYDHGLIFEVGARHWSTLQHLKPNRTRFVHRSPISNDYKTGTYLLSEDVYKVRTWQHWTLRKNGDSLSMLVDGRIVDENRDPSKLSPNLNLVIGQLYPDLSHRPFIGQIDEVAVYERALSDREIKEHYRIGKSAPKSAGASADSLTQMPSIDFRTSPFSDRL